MITTTPWLELLILAFAALVFYLYRRNDTTVENNQKEVRLLIAQNKAEDEDARRELRGEMRNLKLDVDARANTFEKQVLDAIKSLPDDLVSNALCSGKQEIWDVQFQSLIKAMEVANESKAEIDALAHQGINTTLGTVVKDIKQLTECVTALSNDRESK